MGAKGIVPVDFTVLLRSILRCETFRAGTGSRESSVSQSVETHMNTLLRELLVCVCTLKQLLYSSLPC